MAANASDGKRSSSILVSWMASTSTSLRGSQSTSRSSRARIELMFQVAMRIGSAEDRSGWRGGDEERHGPFRSGLAVDPGAPDQHLAGGKRQTGVEVEHHMGARGQRAPRDPAAAEVGLLDLQGLAEAHHPGSGRCRGVGQLDRTARLVLQDHLEDVLLVEELRRERQADDDGERRGYPGGVVPADDLQASADHLQLAELIRDGEVGQYQRHRRLFEDFAHGPAPPRPGAGLRTAASCHRKSRDGVATTMFTAAIRSATTEIAPPARSTTPRISKEGDPRATLLA